MKQSLINDETILHHVAKQCTFKAQQKGAKRGWKFVIRKGGKGDWKNYFNEQQERLINNKTRIKFHGMPEIPYNTDKVIRSML